MTSIADMQPPEQSLLHEYAKPVMRTAAWGSVLLGAAALALASWRHVRAG